MKTGGPTQLHTLYPNFRGRAASGNYTKVADARRESRGFWCPNPIGGRDKKAPDANLRKFSWQSDD